MNLLARLDDAEIRLWTPKERVRAILMERFRRRKETLWGTPLGWMDSSVTMSTLVMRYG